MKKTFVIVYFFVLTILALACLNTDRKPTSKIAVGLYKKDIETLKTETSALVHLIEQGLGEQQLQQQFKKARKAYKKTEWLAEYYNSYTAKSINGPAIPEVEADEKNKIVEPEGFQVIEAFLFPAYDPANRKELLQQSRY